MEFEIDFRSKTPSYQQLAGKIRQAIAAGQYAADDKLPSLKRFTQETGLAQGTVQKAIKLLEAEGLIYTVNGRGTFVTGPPRSLSA